MKLSIVIPTYNRAPILKQALEYLEKQTQTDFEIIIIDDGSTDETKKTISNFQKQSKIQTKYLYQENQKQGTARNLGIKEAQGEIILFLGDDIFALPKLVEEHLSVHQTFPESNIAVLGKTTWDALIDINPYMHFLEWSGWQFNYPQIQKLAPFTSFSEYKAHNHSGKFLPKKSQHWFFYTSNISIKKALLEKENFNEQFKAYGWEDIELGQRLTKKENLHLFYNPNAYAHHHHHQTEADFENKIKTLATSLKFAPNLKPKWYKVWLFKLILPIISLLPLSYNQQMWIKAKKIFYKNL